jgi:hypothetical protein
MFMPSERFMDWLANLSPDNGTWKRDLAGLEERIAGLTEWATLALVIGLIFDFPVLLIFTKEISRAEGWLLVLVNVLVAERCWRRIYAGGNLAH